MEGKSNWPVDTDKLAEEHHLTRESLEAEALIRMFRLFNQAYAEGLEAGRKEARRHG